MHINLSLKCSHILLIVLSSSLVASAQTTVHIHINASSPGDTISPYIYGANDHYEYAPARRLGGNRLTGYNWENNASNSGSDADHSNDNWLPWHYGVPEDAYDSTAALVNHFHEQSIAQDAYTLLTLPMAGFVAKDKSGTVAEWEAAPSSRWAKVVNRKSAAWSLEPDPDDDSVFIDEALHYFTDRYGYASSANGIKGYALDNEPCLWFVTHPRIWGTEGVSATELLNKSFDLAATIKDMDSTAEVFGPGLYGVTAYQNLQFAPDWDAVKGDHNFFIGYYLEKMKLQSAASRKRLLDVLDLHWYPETNFTYGISPFEDGDDENSIAARLEMTRSFWDSTYVEDTWIGSEHAEYLLPLIPKIHEIIDVNYPGTKFALTEYSFMGLNHISGAIAQADALGAFGVTGLYMANYWGAIDGYIKTGFDLYRNYDGAGNAFGNISLPANTDNRDLTAAYASRKTEADGKLHIIAINRSLAETCSLELTITAADAYTSASVYFADSSSYAVQHLDDIEGIEDNRFSYSLAPMSMAHFILDNPALSASTAPRQRTSYTLYPNPASGIVSVDIADAGISGIKITDIAGKVIWETAVHSTGTTKIDMKQYPAGSYFAHFRMTDGIIRTEKFVYTPGY